MFAFVVATALSLAQDQQTVTRTVTVSGPSLNIPDEFAPAAVTYFACKTASRGGDLRQGGAGQSFNPDNIQPGGDCSKIRERQMEHAMTMLKKSAVPRDKRRALVEKTFDEIDVFAAYKPGTAPSNAR